MTMSSLLVFFFYLIIFTLSSPVGIGVGMIMLEMYVDDEEYIQLAFTVLQGTWLHNTLYNTSTWYLVT